MRIRGHRRSADEVELFSDDPAVRLAAAAALDAKRAARLRAATNGWPAWSPGSRNAWLLLITTKPPQWREPLLRFPADDLSLGDPHPGFFYPDPIGFWDEIRRWSTGVLRTRQPSWDTAEALACTAVVHVGDVLEHLDDARGLCRPHVLLFLDEAAWDLAALHPASSVSFHVPDPHRDGKVYQGLWGRLDDGTIVGKAPQHPAMHRLYRRADMDRFLRACPRN